MIGEEGGGGGLRCTEENEIGNFLMSFRFLSRYVWMLLLNLHAHKNEFMGIIIAVSPFPFHLLLNAHIACSLVR